MCLLLDLYRDLDRCSNQGIENYGVSMTTLNEVFLKLEGKSMTDESGKRRGEDGERKGALLVLASGKSREEIPHYVFIE